jgi:hypothetical protein
MTARDPPSSRALPWKWDNRRRVLRNNPVSRLIQGNRRKRDQVNQGPDRDQVNQGPDKEKKHNPVALREKSQLRRIKA